MKISNIKWLVAAAVAVPFAAQAQTGPMGSETFTPSQGFYVGAGGGLEWSLASNSNVSTQTGWAAAGKIGYDFIGPRLEVEVGYGQIPVSVNIPGTAITNKVGALTTMANVLYDFMPTSQWTPYVGAGLGVAFIDSNASLGSTQFAWQAMVGLAYNINSSMRVGIEGRYFGTSNPSVNTSIGNVSYSVQNIMALAGIQFKFGAPDSAPPPPPAAAVAPPSFMVFFDWDRSNLSQQALNTIKQAAAAFKSKGNARITATGHTDTSGPEAYNMALSLRRANSVKDALVREGVPAQAITVIGKGETGLLVKTADGVREPQNRRVEIVIQ